ncbi:MAG: DUF748 domain-containing protein, partial [Planctomycetota bacterium]
AAEYLINDKLNEGDREGSLADVDMGLREGVIHLQDLHLERTLREEIHCRSINVAWRWTEAMQGIWLGEIHLERPEALLITTQQDADEPKQAPPPRSDAGMGVTLPEIIPFTINAISVDEGRVRYLDTTSKPKVDLTLRDVELQATDISNRPATEANGLPASFKLTGTGPGQSRLLVKGAMDATTEQVRAEVDAELTQLDMPDINDLLQAYAGLDVVSGQVDLFTSFTIEDGYVQGEIKILVTKLDVFSWKQEQGEGVLQKVYEAIVGAGAEILENQGEDQQAMRIPIEGRIRNPDSDPWDIIGSVLTNAFIRALLPGVPHGFDQLGEPGETEVDIES